MALSRRIRGEAVTYLHHNQIGSPVYIRCSKSEHPKAGGHEAILAAVILNQPITVVAAVVFDCQALKAIKQVWTAKETAIVVTDGNLNLRLRKSGEHEEHPQARLHSGLSFRLGQNHNTAESSDALCSRVLGNISVHLRDGN